MPQPLSLGDIVEVLLAGQPAYHAWVFVLRPGHPRPYVVRLLHGVGHAAGRPVTDCPSWSAMALWPHKVGAVVGHVSSGGDPCPCALAAQAVQP